MNIYLATAALLAVAMGIVHSWLGELYLVSRLLRRESLPELLGSDRFTRQTIRFAWHLTTVAWWGIAFVLALLSGALPQISVAQGILYGLAATFLASAALPLVFTRGRHLSWIGFLAMAVLCLVAAQ